MRINMLDQLLQKKGCHYQGEYANIPVHSAALFLFFSISFFSNRWARSIRAPLRKRERKKRIKLSLLPLFRAKHSRCVPFESGQMLNKHILISLPLALN